MAESERSIAEEFPNVPRPDLVTPLVNASSAWPLRWPAESEGYSEPYTVLIEQQLE
jgi:hypothetical protein